MNPSQAPAMPVHSADNAALVVYLVLMSAATVGLLVWWWISERRKTGLVLPLLLVGGALSAFLEPFLDNVVLFWYPHGQDMPAFTAFGRTLPLCIPIGYAWFCGGLPYLAARYFAKGVTSRQVWGVAAATLAVDFTAIGATHWLGVAGFYGDATLRIAGYPLWWAPADVILVVGGGALLMVLQHFLKGVKQAYFVVVPVLVVGLSGGAVLGPVSTAMHSGWSSTAVLVCALVTIALGLVVINFLAHAVAALDRLLRAMEEPQDVPPIAATADAPLQRSTVPASTQVGTRY